MAPRPGPRTSNGERARLGAPTGPGGTGATRLDNLAGRARGLRALRSFFDQRAFLEIEAPLLVPSPGLELHLDAFVVEGAGYLITSPEYQLKRLLAGGMERIYSVARCFRRGEAGPHHNPEFTMVEWYRAPGAWEQVAGDVEALCVEVARAVAGTTELVRPRWASGDAAEPRDASEAAEPGDAGEPGAPGEMERVDLALPWERLSVRDAMKRYADLDLVGDEPASELLRKAAAAGHAVPRASLVPWPWDDLFFSVFLDAVEPKLGRGRPTILYDWPAPLCALARRKPGDPHVVERFEAYAAGLELCNGFGELTDAVEQRARLDKDLGERRRRGLPEYPIDEKFLAALGEGIPPAGGVALGFDRLMMLVTGAASIREVSAFTIDEL